MSENNITRRNTNIDMIRGLCILAVLLLHLNIHFALTKTFLKEILPKNVFTLLFWSGFYGVVIFFTLSGYLITNSILKKWGSLSNIDVKTFYWLRFARIIPLLLLILFVLSVLHLCNIEGFIINPEQTSLFRAIVSVLTFHINWLEIKVGYLPANWDILWSISIEETFYLFFPLICYLFLKKDWNFIFILILFLTISPWARIHLFSGSELSDKNHLAYIDSIALGCFSAIISAKSILNKKLKITLLTIGIMMTVSILYFRSFVYKLGISKYGIDVTILSTGIAFLLLFLHNTNHQTVYLKWLENMGKYSYEIYLTHMFVLILGVKFFNHLQLNENWLIPFCLTLIFLSYLLGKIVFNYFSEPVNIKLRKNWTVKNDT